MTRILLLSPTAVPGGAERALTNLARHLPSHGFEVSAVLLADGPLRGWLEEVGCPVTVFPAGRTRHLRQTVSVVRRLTRLARQVDIVISNQSKGHVYGGVAARLAGRPAVWWQHGVPSRTAIETVAATIPTAAIVCGSRGAADAQRRLTPNGQAQLIPPGTDVAAIADRAGSGQAVRERLGWADKHVVGIVGRLEPWKGQEVFLRAAAQIARRHPDVRFAVVGGAILGWEGDYPDKLQRFATDLGIADLVHFAGHQDDVYPWFDAMDVVVHASFGEPFGLVLVEAMALGKPLVATAQGGPLEIVEDGVSGLLVPPGDDRALAAAVERILDDALLAKSLSTAASQHAHDFSSERTASQFAALLADLAPIPTTTPRLAERSVEGLYSHLVATVLSRYARPGLRCVDLGAGTGALAVRLQQLDLDVLGADRDAAGFQAPVPFRRVDLDDAQFPDALGPGQFDLVTAVEVIEHLEAPIAFLRGLARLLTPDGVAVVTTPNVDSLPARLKFLLKGKLRMLDEHDDPTHITPIFWDLLTRQYLNRAGLKLLEHHVYPPRGFIVGRASYQRLLRLVGPLMVTGPPHLMGDNHVLVLARALDRSP
ncbi:MAG: glycosyltransferase [Dermatophilaceae bacterium]